MSVRPYRRSSKTGGCVGRRSRLAARLLFLPASRCWSPAEEFSDPVRVFPALPVGVARKPPATRALKANHVGRWVGAAAHAAVIAEWSFERWHTSPLTTDHKVW